MGFRSPRGLWPGGFSSGRPSAASRSLASRRVSSLQEWTSSPNRSRSVAQ